MLGLYVSVPVACFRKGLAREYLESEALPPPSTCYGFLLSLVGERDRMRHVGVRVTPALLSEPDTSVVLRTMWRLKTGKLGATGNMRPDYQQLLTGIELAVWLDSSHEEIPDGPGLEDRVAEALDPCLRHRVNRFGGLSMGESTHLVDEVSMLTPGRAGQIGETMRDRGLAPRLFRLAPRGLLSLPVWVDHVGSAGTVKAVGELAAQETLAPPSPDEMPVIGPRKSTGSVS